MLIDLVVELVRVITNCSGLIAGLDYCIATVKLSMGKLRSYRSRENGYSWEHLHDSMLVLYTYIVYQQGH